MLERKGSQGYKMVDICDSPASDSQKLDFTKGQELVKRKDCERRLVAEARTQALSIKTDHGSTHYQHFSPT